MSATIPVTRSLPRHPSSEFLHKEAKRLAHTGAMQLAAAQRKLAHEYGYRNWSELMAAAQQMASSGGSNPGGSDPAQPEEPPSTATSAASEFPLLPLRGLVAFPQVSYPVFVGRPASIKAVKHAVEHRGPVVMVAQKDAKLADISASDMYEVGIVGSVMKMLVLPDGTLKTLIEAKRRVRVSRFIFDQDYSKVEAVEVDEPVASGEPVEGLIPLVISAFMARQLDKIADPEGWSVGATTADQASVIADRIASRLPMALELKQALLEMLDPVQRLQWLLASLNASG